MLRVSRIDEGRYDIDDVLERLAALPPSAEPARFALHNIVVTRRRRRLRRPAARDDAPPARPRAGDPVRQLAAVGARDQGRAASRVRARRQPLRFGRRGDAVRRARQRRAARQARRLRGRAVPRLPAARPAGAAARGDARTPTSSSPSSSGRGCRSTSRASSARPGSRSSTRQRSDLLKVGNVKVQIDELRPLERLVRLKQVDIDAPHVVAVRDAAGRVNLLLAAEATTGDGDAGRARAAADEQRRARQRCRPAPSASAARRRASAPAPSAPAPPWRVSVAALALHAGRLDWTRPDDEPRPQRSRSPTSRLNAEKIAWPLAAPVVFRGEGVLGSGAERGKLAFSGQGDAVVARRSRCR